MLHPFKKVSYTLFTSLTLLRFLKIGNFLMLFTLLIACRTNNPTAEELAITPLSITANPPKTNIISNRDVIQFAVNERELSKYETLVRAFEAENRDIHIKLLSINEILGPEATNGLWPEDSLLRLATSVDVFPAVRDVGATHQGLIRDLTPFIEADPNFESDDFYANTLNIYRWQGGLWAIPVSIDVEFLIFNKDLFDTAGVPYPEPGWTWDDFSVTVKAMTMRQENETIQWGYVSPFSNHTPFIVGRVGSLVDMTTVPPTPRFITPNMVTAVRWYTDMYVKEEIIPFFDAEKNQFGIEEYSLINSGKVAIWPGNLSSWAGINATTPRGVVSYPIDPTQTQTQPITVNGFSMSGGTQHPEAAWRWIDFLSRQYATNDTNYLLPARQSVAESSGYWNDLDATLVMGVRYAIEHADSRTAEIKYSYVNDAVESVLMGNQTVEVALTNAQVQAEFEIGMNLLLETEVTPAPTIAVSQPIETGADMVMTTITFIPGNGFYPTAQYHVLAKTFQENNPDINVVFRSANSLGNISSLKDVAEVADCFQWFPELDSPDNLVYLLSLDPLVEVDTAIHLEDFFPAVLDNYVRQGQLWGIPAYVRPAIIEYNKDVFDTANVAYPVPGWTMDKFLEIAVALTTNGDEEKIYGFVPDAIESGSLMTMLGQFGVPGIDVGSTPLQVNFTNPVTVEAMRWYVGLSAEFGVKPLFITDIATTFGGNDTDYSPFIMRESLIDNDRAGMWLNYGTRVRFDLRDQVNGNTGFVPLPVGPGRNDGQLGSEGFFISATSQAPQACWQWITFLSEQVIPGQGLPARRSVAESEAYRQQEGAELADAYLLSVTQVDETLGLPTFYQLDNWLQQPAALWLSRAYGQAARGELSVEAALDTAQVTVDAYWSCVVTRNGATNTDKQWECLQEVDKSLPGIIFGQTDE